jgi:two-component system NtrC family sensor kinase
MPRWSLRSKLILNFSLVVLIGMTLSVIVGLRLIGKRLVEQAQDKVRLDLNSAWEVYQGESERIKDIVRLTAVRFFIKEEMSSNDLERLETELAAIREREGLDVMMLLDDRGNILLRTGSGRDGGGVIDDGGGPGDGALENDTGDAVGAVVGRVLERHKAVVSTQVLTQERLQRESPELAEQARIRLIPTPKARPRGEPEETAGMMITAAAPVFDYDGSLMGILSGGVLLNRNNHIVDRVKDIVYRGERYQGKDIGTATIFLGDVRIATNVMRAGGIRAIGTQVSQEVFDQVIGLGRPWVGRAFVVNDWYITAYEPIRDIENNIIGMLYVGLLEAPYADLKNRVLMTFLGIAFVSILALAVIAFLTTTRIMRRLRALSVATQKVAGGDLTYRLRMKADDEIGHLGNSFNRMTEELHKATEKYRTLMSTLEDKVKEKTAELRQTQDQLVQSEKLTSLGRFAAGIAHEVNNPLTSILINSHLVAERLERDDRLQEHLQLIIDETTRCGSIVKGLLDFSRQTPPQKVPANINEVVEKTLLLLNSQIIMQKVEVETELEDDLPRLQIDVNQMQQVFANMVLNALDAMPKGGRLSFRTQKTAGGRLIEVRIGDTGRGISREHLSKIFDPFFTTKGTAGTGLGLSVSYGIVRRHGGTIEVVSEVGQGTTMIIRLPVEEPASKSAKRGE